MRGCAAGVVALAVAVLGCDQSARDRALSLRAGVEAEAGRLVEFEPWARRVVVASARESNDAALAETAFAPLAADRQVTAAWLELEGVESRLLRYRNDSPVPSPAWTTVRRTRYGDVEAAWIAIDGRRQLALRRSQPVDGRTRVRITLVVRPRA